MKIREIIFEDLDGASSPDIEDEADSRGDGALITTLEWLRTEAEKSRAVTPRVAVDTVIDRVRAIPGNEAFNFAALDAAFKSNDSVKNLVKKIEDDTHSGTKYIYLQPPESQPPSEDDLGMPGTDAGGADSSKIVSKMAARAAGK